LPTIDYRRQGRSLALQVLYELDCTHHALADVMQERLISEDWQADTRAFARRIVQGVIEHREQIDSLIHQFAPEWPLDQIAIIDRNTLRIALYEMAVDQSIPVKVAINEAVELAKNFGAESAPRFINGVLGSVAAQIQQNDGTSPANAPLLTSINDQED
jgi:N utilization substance protein B